MWWIGIAFVIIIIIFLLTQKPKPKSKEKDLSRVSSQTGRRKVIWLMVDSLMAPAVDLGVKNGELPAISFLIQHGHYQKGLVSSFPTMSVTADTSFLTGAYPDQHGVPGLIWFDEQQKRLVNYGTGLGEMIQDGWNQVAEDAIINLNQKHLNPQVQTVYEELEKQGIKTGSVNGMIYRGTRDHELTFPVWMSVPSSIPRRLSVKGPDFLSLGALTNPLQEKISLPDGPLSEFGLKDAYSIDTVKFLIKENRLPNFLFVYLPDPDKPIHGKGPGPQERQELQKVDREIAQLLDAFGSWDEALRQAIWAVCGDGGQTAIHPADQQPVVRLDQLLQNYKTLQPGRQPDENTDVVLAVNERSAYVYALKEEVQLEELADRLKEDDRIDILAWVDDDGWVRIVNSVKQKQMRFRPGGEWTDPYSQTWELEEEPAALDLNLDQKRKQITYGEYPDGLVRLHAALHSHAGRYLLVTARPGYELADTASPTHKGGAGHGSLHRIDSTAPLIIAGTDQLPSRWRIVDLKDYILTLLTPSP
ncbi:Predicted pyrophosphatase or phosphodiesterase, AlkP superfamily [Melghirimyces thermohalophilus]|uniref:Predicted pyrophosphatase or phosphodiesterase, AlkP superfamily n=1 Tax=Melghirimyces thermohalophilus TaxID=1236220 RepID=A0A1G6IY32_9BACL|nr:alkaline phosphatase family protein [Melghirimyces thermohalophilus]SDC11293.1 Predicted pyrophosphatase or phosphodiesterase, AlkP superfamily [Melghirimyces thermohalophilus]